eukprot:TRINITY_DN7925_c0_g4_i1.p1 TRINITY_DN7925_c0_g4~~TRINITY_DN7925_c0_g4_i1.p1  ORF type:complete len:251 (-),score=32.78 TRINITY_DN7925_c0_g4_i1:72-824(-)
MFPDLKEDGMDESVLLGTIRVPNNLLFLTDRLPKPNYNSCKIQNPQRNTMMEGHLPDIRKNRFFRAQHDNPYKESINITQIKNLRKTPVHRQPTDENKEHDQDFEDSNDNTPAKPIMELPARNQSTGKCAVGKSKQYKDCIPFIKKLLHRPVEKLACPMKGRQCSLVPRKVHNPHLQRLIQKQDSHSLSPYLELKGVLKQKWECENERRLKPLRGRLNPVILPSVIIEGLRVQQQLSPNILNKNCLSYSL